MGKKLNNLLVPLKEDPIPFTDEEKGFILPSQENYGTVFQLLESDPDKLKKNVLAPKKVSKEFKKKIDYTKELKFIDAFDKLVDARLSEKVKSLETYEPEKVISDIVDAYEAALVSISSKLSGFKGV